MTWLLLVAVCSGLIWWHTRHPTKAELLDSLGRLDRFRRFRPEVSDHD